MITHNALHVPAFNYAAPQLALQCLLTVAYGQPVSVYLPIHNRSHHRHTGTRADLMRPQKMPHRWNALNLFTAHLYSPGTGAGVRFLVRFVRAQWGVGKRLVLTWALEASALVVAMAVGFRASWWRGLLYGVAEPQPPACCFTRQRAVGPRGLTDSSRVPPVCEILISPAPRRTPPRKSSYRFWNKSLMKVSSTDTDTDISKQSVGCIIVLMHMPY